MNWTYKKAHTAFMRPVPCSKALWTKLSSSDNAFRMLSEIRAQVLPEKRHDMDVLAPMVATWLRWKYEKRVDTPTWHHWFLEPEMVGVFMQANTDGLPISKVQLPPGTGLRVFSHDMAGCYADILIASTETETDPFLLLSINVYNPDGTATGTACLFPWDTTTMDNIGDAYEESMLHVQTDDDNARQAIFECLVVGISAWLYFTSTEPDIVLLEDPDYERAMRKVARLTGAVQRKAKREIGKKPPGHQVFRLRDLPAPQHVGPVEPASREHAEHDKTSRVAHMVRSHWRWQACGPRWSQHKLVLVKPHMRGDDSLGTVGYRFKGVAS